MLNLRINLLIFRRNGHPISPAGLRLLSQAPGRLLSLACAQVASPQINQLPSRHLFRAVSLPCYQPVYQVHNPLWGLPTNPRRSRPHGHRRSLLGSPRLGPAASLPASLATNQARHPARNRVGSLIAFQPVSRRANLRLARPRSRAFSRPCSPLQFPPVNRADSQLFIQPPGPVLSPVMFRPISRHRSPLDNHHCSRTPGLARSPQSSLLPSLANNQLHFLLHSPPLSQRVDHRCSRLHIPPRSPHPNQ